MNVMVFFVFGFNSDTYLENYLFIFFLTYIILYSFFLY